jgi:hypothetical protein
MTSYTKKLYRLDPAAAHRIHRQELHDYRYGKHVTLAQFAMPNPRGWDEVDGVKLPSVSSWADTNFGKRVTPPVLPAYECWAPELGKPKQIVRAANSFEARKQYAAYHQIAVTEVCARSR